MVLSLCAYAQGSDDFGTITKANGYTSFTSEAGWTAENTMFYSEDMETSSQALIINGKTSAVGKITSPTLTGGCGTLTINYAYTFSEKNGVSFHVAIMQNGAVAKEYDVIDTELAKATPAVSTTDINVAGDFSIVITNNSPTNKNGNSDRYAIWGITWTGYAGEGGDDVTPGEPDDTTDTDTIPVPEPVVITPPSITPTDKYIANSVEVTITAEDGLKIYYTTDGTTPTVESTEYTAPFTLSAETEKAEYTVTAIAVDADGNVSEAASQAYVINVVKPMEIPEGHIGFDFVMNPWNFVYSDTIPGNIIEQDGATITLDQKDASTPAKAWSYNGGGQLRIYKKSTFTINAPEGKVITSVVVKLAKGEIVYGDETAATTSWDGSEEAVTFTCTSNAQIETILIKVEDKPAVVVEAPVITPATDTYAGEQTVTITATEGHSIYYTLDGTEPSDASTPYEGPFTVSSTTTIKAIATNDDDVPSAVTSVTITIMPSYTTIAAMLEDITSDKVDVMYTFDSLLVMGVAKANVYVSDGTNAFLLYAYDAPFKAGDVISGSVLGQLYLYNNLPELSLTGDKWANVTVLSSDNEVKPAVKTIAEVTDANLNEFVRLEELSFVEVDGSNYTFTDGTNNIIIRDNFKVIKDSLSTEEKYNINAFVSIYKTTLQLYPLTADDVELITVLKKAEAAWEQESMEAVLTEATTEPIVLENKFTTLSDGEVTFSSSNEAVAVVDAEGKVTVVAHGIAVITASVAETGKYLADEASFTVIVRSDADGTFANPYLVSDVMAAYESGDTISDVWVKGYIVGYVDGSKMSDAVFAIPEDSLKTNLLIAVSADEVNPDNCFPIQLPKGWIRENLDVCANSGLYKAEILLFGDIIKYFGVAGMKNTSDYSLDGENQATGITGVATENKAPKGIYTISGQKVNAITKGGIYIIDGKKVFVK